MCTSLYNGADTDRGCQVGKQCRGSERGGSTLQLQSAAPVRLLLLSISLINVGESCVTLCNLFMVTRKKSELWIKVPA